MEEDLAVAGRRFHAELARSDAARGQEFGEPGLVGGGGRGWRAEEVLGGDALVEGRFVEQGKGEGLGLLRRTMSVPVIDALDTSSGTTEDTRW